MQEPRTLLHRAHGLLVLGLYLMYPTNARACSCSPPTLDEAREGSDLIFAGRVVDPGYSIGGGLLTGKVRFEVLDLYKGSVGKTVRVSMYSRGNCGPDLLPAGMELLVFANNDEDWLPGPNYWVYPCSRTALLSHATEEVRALGAPIPISSGANVSGPVLVTLASLGVLACTGVAWQLRRWRRGDS
ncbi:hypothetical protein [Vitiosangium sp. GDMCC 1.1324]|uniref:hypothetical protein n=1 Tax=Vitiosangium sp. (strain GDMCC 1.1324) TaxID=2138576 RepID=UPI000D38DF14|nr:hypothetical protein [Vitiosangium sp. GDMCC 1.1324]PTL75115.1 hypothetical protein DAT35_56435 [Vitiosangium sp. GDMCC 1.1324]